jgi:hypothetical protein
MPRTATTATRNGGGAAPATKTRGRTSKTAVPTPDNLPPLPDTSPNLDGAKPVAEVHRLQRETLLVPIVGTAPLVVHRFSEKAKRQMLDNMQGRKSPKEPKNPEAEYLAAFYRFNDANDKDENGPFGFPVIAFKAATVGGARFYDQVTMTGLRQMLFMRGEIGKDGQMLARIEGTPHMREDVVRVNRSGTDLRYRPEFPEWETTLAVTYLPSLLTRNSVLSLIEAGGLGVGVGEWRPEKGGDFGTFTIDESRDVQVINA